MQPSLVSPCQGWYLLWSVFLCLCWGEVFPETLMPPSHTWECAKWNTTQKIVLKRERALSGRPRPFVTTCCRDLLPRDFSTETLVCVSSRDTDLTKSSPKSTASILGTLISMTPSAVRSFYCVLRKPFVSLCVCCVVFECCCWVWAIPTCSWRPHKALVMSASGASC